MPAREARKGCRQQRPPRLLGVGQSLPLRGRSAVRACKLVQRFDALGDGADEGPLVRLGVRRPRGQGSLVDNARAHEEEGPFDVTDVAALAHDGGRHHEGEGDLVFAEEAARDIVVDRERGVLHDVGQARVELGRLVRLLDADEEELVEVVQRELVHLTDVA